MFYVEIKVTKIGEEKLHYHGMDNNFIGQEAPAVDEKFGNLNFMKTKNVCFLKYPI